VVNALSWLTTAALATTAMWVGHKRDALRRWPWTIIALLTAISLLPVYHRGYDRAIALALAPAAVEINAKSRWLAWAYALMVALWIANDTVMTHVLRRWHYMPQSPVEDVLFCALLLASLWMRFEEPRLVAS
jgi:hypothetical protein